MGTRANSTGNKPEGNGRNRPGFDPRDASPVGRGSRSVGGDSGGGRFASKQEARHTVDDSNMAAEDEALKSLRPALFDYMCVTKYGDGSPRKTSTLLSFCEDGVFKICINDRENSRSAFVSGRSFEEALDVLETALDSDTVEWRHKGYRGGGRR